MLYGVMCGEGLEFSGFCCKFAVNQHFGAGGVVTLWPFSPRNQADHNLAHIKGRGLRGQAYSGPYQACKGQMGSYGRASECDEGMQCGRHLARGVLQHSMSFSIKPPLRIACFCTKPKY